MGEAGEVAVSATDERRKVADLTPHPGNYRHHPLPQQEKLRASLRLHGQQKPVVITPENVILAGHGLWMAAQAEGWEGLWVKVYDGPHAEAFLIADNASADLAEDDPKALAALLQELEATGDLEAALYSPDDLGSLLASLQEGVAPEGLREDPAAGVPPERWLIIVECAGENEQLARLEELTEKGWQCRAAVS